eukprot:TRINITY_DN67841_c0_g1_i1.p1 TRINITY_DN67841_c0_g1~~TRINITY_DN67841_c0_g1_i1.p1  ORF type:complete len:639 (-),score=110.52 TRINITY_DN67841_c0_g1_i1:288-2204(-)
MAQQLLHVKTISIMQLNRMHPKCLGGILFKLCFFLLFCTLNMLPADALVSGSGSGSRSLSQSQSSLLSHMSSESYKRFFQSVSADASLAEFSQFAMTASLEPDKASGTLREMENLIVSYAQKKEDGQLLGALAGPVSEIARILDQTIKVRVQEQLKLWQKTLDEFHTAFDDCSENLKKLHVEGKTLHARVSALSQTSLECRKAQFRLNNTLYDCQNNGWVYELQNKEKQEKCRLMRDRLVSQPQGQQLCAGREGCAGEHYRKLAEYWQNIVNWYDGNETECKAMQEMVDSHAGNCSSQKHGLSVKMEECKNWQVKLSGVSCSMVNHIEQGCASYDSCYDLTLSHYQEKKSSASMQEADLKRQWQSVLRIECLIDVFQDITVEAFKACMSKDFDTAHISFTYPSVPEPLDDKEPFSSTCRNMTEDVPGTVSYVKKHFSQVDGAVSADLRHTPFCPSQSGGQLYSPSPAGAGGSALLSTSADAAAGPQTCPGNYSFNPQRSSFLWSSLSEAEVDAGLDGDHSWSPAIPQKGEWLQVDLGRVKAIGGAIVQGGSQLKDGWVTSYRLQTSLDGMTFTSVPNVLGGSRDSFTKVGSGFQPPLEARYLRFVVETWHGSAGMRVGLLLCKSEETAKTELPVLDVV